MPDARNGTVLQQISTLFRGGATAGLTDGELLERFAARRGEASEQAFAALVERHGPLVLRTCRAVLRDGAEAQDAFQATFLILVRKAGSLWVGDSLAPWLHRVAYRVAVRTRVVAARRKAAEREAAERSQQIADDRDPTRADLGSALHEEIDRLPEYYRVPIVLCGLEGHTCEQAARALGRPLGTIQSRLARGRQRLRDRLARRGLSPAAVPWRTAPTPALPAALAGGTARAAMECLARRGMTAGLVSASVETLIEGALRAMILNRLKMVVLALAALGTLAAGAAGLAQPEDPRGQPRRDEGAGAPRLKFEIRSWKDGEATGAPIVVDLTDGAGCRVETGDVLIEIRPRARRIPSGQARGEVPQPRPAEEPSQLYRQDFMNQIKNYMGQRKKMLKSGGMDLERRSLELLWQRLEAEGNEERKPDRIGEEPPRPEAEGATKPRRIDDTNRDSPPDGEALIEIPPKARRIPSGLTSDEHLRAVQERHSSFIKQQLRRTVALNREMRARTVGEVNPLRLHLEALRGRDDAEQFRNDVAEMEAMLRCREDAAARSRRELEQLDALWQSRKYVPLGIRGRVTRVNPVAEIAVIDRGSNDGLVEGQRLFLYRGQGSPELVGKFLILWIDHDQATGKLVDSAPGREMRENDVVADTEAQGKPGGDE